ncbi:MAG: aminotransferase class I/II-fold pyridoxal phosphate-dependent enzyme [Candidatus Margulisbacteria bacterium]|nr:aminotransferase class I/II-fold pyridoxal phosphate-dependent enzyme [Candidatus Margulisiibacteriota bacterium]
MTLLSHRVNHIQPSGIRVFFDLVMSSTGIISLGVGEPDFSTPWSIRSEAIYRLDKGYTTYTSNVGLMELRDAICSHLATKFSINYTPKEVLITNGVSEGLDIVFRSFINPGDEVILPEPAYVCYRPLIELCDGAVVSLDTSSTNFIPDPDAIEALITPKTKAIVLCYPNNPTGQSIPFDVLQRVAKLALRHGCLIITDEIYADLAFGDFTSIATIPDLKSQLIYLNGFSKAYSMTGWRIGYVCAPSEYIESMNKIHQYSALCAPTISQYAAIEACKSSKDDIPKMVKSYEERARYFSTFMNGIGLETIMPSGGLYCFTSINHLPFDSLTFAEQLLNNAKVAVVPGNVFGCGGEGYFRSCIATDFNDLKKAALGIQQFVDSL